jgi:hypothetical protein
MNSLGRASSCERPAAGPPATSRAAAREAAATAWRGGPPLSRGQALAALALLDPQQHALGIDIADLERDDLGDPQPGAPAGPAFRPARGQAPAVASAALYFGLGAAWSSSVTSSTLSTAGSRRGSRTILSRRARSGRSSVTVKKKRRAATALLMLGRLHRSASGAAGSGGDPPSSPCRESGR